MADVAAQTRSPQTVYVSFTIRRERMTVIGHRHLLLCEPRSAEPKLVEFCIKTAGEITGSYIDANNAYHRFVYDANGTRTEVDAPDAGTNCAENANRFAGND
jgi:YD repeat-containing protein